MGQHPNVATLEKGYAAFAKGDLDTIRGVFADDIVFHVGVNNPLAGDYKGQDEVFGFFGRITQESGGTFSLEIHDILANDEHAVVLAHATAERNGKRLDQNVVHVWHLTDGKATENWTFPSDSATADEFWS